MRLGRGARPSQLCHPDAADALQVTKATALVLSYSRLVKISNLAAMRSLRTLRLDNNAIGEWSPVAAWNRWPRRAPPHPLHPRRAAHTVAERIEGLETLVHVQKLDLSFNAITAIEGLGTLAELQELTLYGNKITALGGLDAQRHCLQVLSVGRNAIGDVRQLSYLRGFPALRLLCTEGNFRPASSGPTLGAGTVDNVSYRPSVLAQLPRLAYLDWSMVTAAEREAAAEMHQRLLQVEAQAASDSADEARSLAPPVAHTADGDAATGVFDARAASCRPATGLAMAAVDTSAARDAGLLDVALLWRLLTKPETAAEIPAAAPPPGSPGGKAVAGAAAIGAAPSQGDIDAVFRVPSIASRVSSLHETVSVAVEQALSRGLALQSQASAEEAAMLAVLQGQIAASDHESRRRIDEFETMKKHLLRKLAETDEEINAAIAAKQAARRSVHAAATAAAAGGRASPSKRMLRARSSTMSSLNGDGGDGGMDARKTEAAEAALARLEELHYEAAALATRLVAMETVLHEHCVAVITEFETAFSEVSAAARLRAPRRSSNLMSGDAASHR